VHSASSLVQPLADNATASSRTLLQASNPWAMLQSIIQGICGDWSSIVNAFKSSYSEQLDYEQLTRGWSKFKEATKVFKGEGLTYDKAPEFFKDIQSMIQIPANYSKDFDQMIKFIQFFDKEYWSEHTTTFNIGQGGTASHFTMLANNNQDTSKIDVMFITLSESFALAPDVFVITESHSYLGGIWSTSKIKFDKHPAAISSEELEFVNQYFLLSAYQEIALAEGQPPPPNPNFGPSPTPMLTNTSHWASKGPLDTCTGPHESCCPAPGGDVNNCPASARTSDCDKKKSCCCG